MTDKEVMQMALETAEQIASADYRHWEELASLGEFERWARSRANHIAEALRTALAQPESAECDGGQCGIGGYCKQCPKTQPDVPETAFWEMEPVAIKFQIYKQTPQRGRELEPINSALLPWVYDQDPSSGNTASMWVTPVATLPPQPELEPVAWVSNLPDNKIAIKIAGKPTEGNWEPLYTAPPKREWVGLTDAELAEFSDARLGSYDLCLEVEAKLKEKNT